MSVLPNTPTLAEQMEIYSRIQNSSQWQSVPPEYFTSEWRSQELKRLRELESLRLKEQLSQEPFHAERAARLGERYWRALAASYTPI